MEIWKELCGYDCAYEVSSYGRIRNSKTNKLLKLIKEPRKDGNTRVRCGLRQNNTTKTKIVARLVLEAFSPINNPENYHADHMDHDPTNNNLFNLRWLTPEQNNLNRRKRINYKKLLQEKDKIIAELKQIIDRIENKI